jgi:protein phosphatase
MIAYGLIDRGCKREKNEDSILLNDQINLYIVADGIGGQGSRGIVLTSRRLARAACCCSPRTEAERIVQAKHSPFLFHENISLQLKHALNKELLKCMLDEGGNKDS